MNIFKQQGCMHMYGFLEDESGTSVVKFLMARYVILQDTVEETATVVLPGYVEHRQCTTAVADSWSTPLCLIC